MVRKKRRKLASDTLIYIGDSGEILKEIQLPFKFDVKELGYFVILYGKVKGKRDHYLRV